MMKDGKLFGKLNLIDLVALLIVLALAVTVGLRATVQQNDPSLAQSGTECDVLYRVKVEGVRTYTLEALEQKGILYDLTTTTELGEIVDVTHKAAEFEGTDMYGNIIISELPQRYDCTVTIKTKGYLHIDNGKTKVYNVNGDSLHLGYTQKILTKWVECTGTITMVEHSN